MKLLKKVLTITATQLTALFLFAQSTAAQITNPALSAGMGGAKADATAAQDGTLFASYFIRVWQLVISIGGLMVVLYFIWGSLEWILAGGDQSKIQKGRDRIVQAVIGMILLAGSFVIVTFINQLFFADTFDILNLSF